MILTQILEYLRSHEVASLTEVARSTGSSPDAVRPMLQTLVRKRLIHQVRPGDGCPSGCGQCSQVGVELYAYGDAPPTTQSACVPSLR